VAGAADSENHLYLSRRADHLGEPTDVNEACTVSSSTAGCEVEEETGWRPRWIEFLFSFQPMVAGPLRARRRA
jgi:hypothetical protein